MDAADPLARYRARFHLPPGRIYLDGNSLGPLSIDGEACLERVVDEWKRLGIEAWFGGKPPWFHLAESLGAELAPLVGAKPEEIVATGATTINLHALVATFYRPTGRRTRVLADMLTFPSDIYALRSQIQLRGLEPAEHLVLARGDGLCLDESELIDAMDDRVALVVLPSVLYRSGQLLDVARLAEEAHRRGIPIGFDCSHSVGVVPHDFRSWGVDFAFWCSYKYLGGGPGAPGFLFLSERHFGLEPALAGWFGYRKKHQFGMHTEFDHQPGAGGWQISSPGIVGMAPIEGSIKILREAGLEAIRGKSLKMTSYLMWLVDEILGADSGFQIVTPREPHRRGGHVALAHHKHAEATYEKLMDRGIVTDRRPPNIIRIAPHPLYNTYEEIWDTIRMIRQITN